MDFINTYVNDDAFLYLARIPDKSVDLVFTSPPDLSQTQFDKTQLTEYKVFLQRAMDEFARITKTAGFIVMCQTDRKLAGTVFPKNAFIINYMMEDCGLPLKDYKIVVKNKFGKKDIYRFTYQHLLCFTCIGKIPTEKRKGDWLLDMLVDEQVKVAGQPIWSQKFCSLVINALTNKGDLVIDPFAGVAPVLFAAKRLGRQYWGAEIAEERYNPNFELFMKDAA